MPKKRTDGRYEVKVRVSKPGEPRKYKSVYGDTLKEAKAQAEIVRQSAADSNKRSDATVNDIIEYWLAQKAKTVRPQTLTNYTTALRFAKNYTGGKRIVELTVDDARQLQAQVAEKSVYQANRMTARMYSVYQDAIIRGIVKENPFAYVAPFRREKAEKRALAKAELDAVFAADLLPWERAFISVLRYTGMRKGEALALTAEDIKFDSGYIEVSKTVVDGRIGPPKTKSSVRRIPMPVYLAKVLAEYLAEYSPGEGLLFPNLKGRPVCDRELRRRWDSIKKKAFGNDPPKDFTPHIFRHTYASELVRNKVPPTTAMLLLGHKDLKTTMGVYIHLGWQDIDAEQINNIFLDN